MLCYAPILSIFSGILFLHECVEIKGIACMIQKIAFTSQVPVQSVRNGSNIEILEPVEEKKNDSSALILGSLAVLGAFGLGCVMKNSKTVGKAVKDIAEKQSQNLEKNAKDIVEQTNTPKKAYRRKKLKKQDVERLIDEETITKEQQASYDRQIAYKKPTKKQRQFLDKLERDNQEQRSQTNTIGNLAKIKTAKPQKPPVDNKENEIKALEGSIRELNRRIFGAKRFFKDTSELEKQLANLQEKLKSLQAV